MTTATPGSADYLESLVNVETGELDRRIFSDEEIFDLEMKNIFGRAWLFLCHETQIPKKGDFFEAPMGKDNVLVVRQRDGGIKAMLNTCTHRGNAVCRAEEGNVRNFMCTYTLDVRPRRRARRRPGDGRLLPRRSRQDEVSAAQGGPARHLQGFVFATMDAEAPPLEEFLGRTGRVAIDLIAEKGAVEAHSGVQKFTLNCNWKFAADNSFDFYHPQITHISAQAVGMIPSTDVSDSGGAKTDEGRALGVQRLPSDLESWSRLESSVTQSRVRASIR